MMNAAGIDVSNGKSTICVLCPPGKTAAKPFEARHTNSELRELASCLKSLDGETKVVMEHTGRYYEPAAQYLCDAGILVSAVNPRLIKDYGNNSLRKIKTDRADSRKTAKYGLANWSELRQYTSMDKRRYQLKVLNQQHSHLTSTRTSLMNNLIATLEMTYPDANKLFSSRAREGETQKWVDFVKTFWHLNCVCGTNQTVFKERYQKWYEKNKIQGSGAAQDGNVKTVRTAP